MLILTFDDKKNLEFAYNKKNLHGKSETQP